MRKIDYINKIHRLEKRLKYLKDVKCENCKQSLIDFITNKYERHSLREINYYWECNDCAIDEHLHLFGNDR